MERENINMNDKPEIEIKIFGGTNMIAPAGATAVQPSLHLRARREKSA